NVAGCGSGCRGKLGLGIIDANKALAQPIVKQEISEGELVRNRQTSQVFYVQYGRKRLVGSFVQSQRFSTISPRDVDHSVLQNMLSGISLEPLDGTLLKFQDSPAVYLVQKAALRPISFEIFKIRRYNFSSIKVVSSQEGKDWVRSGFLPPPDGTVLRVRGNRTVFWVLENLVHPVSKRYFYQYGLHELPQTFVTPQTLRSLQFGKVLQ
ncbi:MAG TPA: hypothetical protein VEA59_05065, partial [Patescibacteria group bacterium]|nr:hypothetical protein [Patescibacteria group bacterium]